MSLCTWVTLKQPQFSVTVPLAKCSKTLNRRHYELKSCFSVACSSSFWRPNRSCS